LVTIAVRCYPPAWRDRHGEEATELAELLIRDGLSPRRIAWSYLRAATRERVVAGPGRRIATALGALALGATFIGVPLVLLASSTPANASSRNEVIATISNRNHAASELEAVFRLHHFKIDVEQEPSAPNRVGSILAVKASSAVRLVLRELPGQCAGGGAGCIDAIAVPLHFSGSAQVLIGRRAKRGDAYFNSSDVRSLRP
jgi:hypothetical protein